MRNKIMGSSLLAIAAIAGALLIGLAYANTNSITNNSLGSNSLGSNTFLINSTNGIIPIGIHKSASVTCYKPAQNVIAGNSVECGHWTVMLSNVTTSDNVTSVELKVNFTFANGTAAFTRFIKIDSGHTRRICVFGYLGLMHFDRGIGLNHRCLFVTVSSAGGGSANIQLVGAQFVRHVNNGHHNFEINENHGKSRSEIAETSIHGNAIETEVHEH